MTAYTRHPTTVSLAQAAVRWGCSHHTGLRAAGGVLPRQPGATGLGWACYAGSLSTSVYASDRRGWPGRSTLAPLQRGAGLRGARPGESGPPPGGPRPLWGGLTASPCAWSPCERQGRGGRPRRPWPRRRDRHTSGRPRAGGARRHARPLGLGRRQTPGPLAGLTGSRGRPATGSLPRRDARPRPPRARDGRHVAHASSAGAPAGAGQGVRALRGSARAAGPTPRPPGVPHTSAAPTGGAPRCARPTPSGRFPEACRSAPMPRTPSRPRATQASSAPGGAGRSLGWPARRPRRNGSPSRRTPRRTSPGVRAARPSWLGPDAGQGGTGPVPRWGASS